MAHLLPRGAQELSSRPARGVLGEFAETRERSFAR